MPRPLPYSEAAAADSALNKTQIQNRVRKNVIVHRHLVLQTLRSLYGRDIVSVHLTARGLYYAAVLVSCCTLLAGRRLYDLIRRSKWLEQPVCTNFSSFDQWTLGNQRRRRVWPRPNIVTDTHLLPPSCMEFASTLAA